MESRVDICRLTGLLSIPTFPFQVSIFRLASAILEVDPSPAI